jgi:hypothetical protein
LRPLIRTVGLLSALAAQLSWAAESTPAKQTLPAKQPAAKQAPKQAPTAKPAVKPAVAEKSTSTKAIPPKTTAAASAKPTYAKPIVPKSAAAGKPAVRKAPVYPRYYAQQQPAPERYKEIQQALVDKGYFSGSPDGVWGATSTDALKRFQHDQNLNEDGKLDSLSIIALGLGPKRAATNVEQPATK